MVGMFKWQAYKCVAPRVAPTCYIGTAYLRKLRGVSKPLICTSMWKHTPGEWSSDEISRIRNDSVVATLLCVKKKKKTTRWMKWKFFTGIFTGIFTGTKTKDFQWTIAINVKMSKNGNLTFEDSKFSRSLEYLIFSEK